MESYQFFKICRHFDRESKKTLVQQSIRKETLRKFELCFITDCLIKPFNMVINHFLFRKLIHSAIFAFGYQDDARNIKRGSWERQIARIGNLQYFFQK